MELKKEEKDRKGGHEGIGYQEEKEDDWAEKE